MATNISATGAAGGGAKDGKSLDSKASRTKKHYLRDHSVLLLLGTNAFLVLVTVVWTLVRLGSIHSDAYIVQYRPALGINAFKTGSAADLLSFVLFALLVFGIHFGLSHRVYKINRYLSLAILALGILLLLLGILISNALLTLH